MIHLQSLLRYFKVGNFLHIVALFALKVGLFALLNLNLVDHSTDLIVYLFWGSLTLLSGNIFVLAELDGYSRFQNYKQVKDQVYINGYQRRILKPLTRSSCQREAAILACSELGLGNEAKDYFFKKGYRWYHVIPDFVFANPLFFFSKFFWRTTFFTPYYKPKFNYDKLDLSQLELLTKGAKIDSAA